MYDYIFFTDITDTILATKPIGVYKIAHVLREQGEKCLVVDHLHAWDWQEFQELIDTAVGPRTKALGFSNTFMQNSSVEPGADGSITFRPLPLDKFFPQGPNFENQFIQYVKKINPDIKIIIGGARARPDFSNRNADFVVLGYGESAILSINRHLSTGDSIPFSRKNLWGIVIIDDRASTGYDFQHSTFVWESTDVVNARVLPLEVSRGCIFKCSFCSYPMNGKKDLDFVRTSDLLRAELQRNYDLFKVKTFWLLDDTFNDNEYKLDLFLDAVQKLSFRPEFWAYLRLDLLSTRKHVDKLYDIGLRYMYFGIETLNSKTGRAVGKGYNRNKQIDTIKYIKQKYPDVRMHGSFIVGLPYESIESCRDTVEKCMSKEIPLDSFNIKDLRISRQEMISWASEIDKHPEKFGYTILPTPSGQINLNWKNEHTNNLEAAALADEWNKKGYMSPGFKIPGRNILSLKNYDCSEEFLNIDYRDIDWHELSCKKNEFVVQYKKQLKKILEDQLLKSQK
jgi:hypothetical protein